MAGRLVDLKNTFPLHKMPKGYYQPMCYKWMPAICAEIEKRAEFFKEFETYTDLTSHCDDEPCRFNNFPTRRFFFEIKYETKTWVQTYVVHSVYWPLTNFLSYYGLPTDKPHCVIFLLTDDSFAGGVFTEGELVASEEFHASKVPFSKTGANDFYNKVRKVLQDWDSHVSACRYVFVRCSYKNKVRYFEDLGKSEEKYSHVPFVTGIPSVEEVKRVFDKVTRYENHGSTQKTLEFLKREKKMIMEKSAEMPSTSTSPQGVRRQDKMTWSWVNPKLTKRLIECIENDDGEGLFAEVASHSRKSEVVDYLNSCNDNFNQGTFLHFAATRNAPSAVECLLELGCDPTVSDSTKRVPYDYAHNSEVQQTFILFRNEHSDLYKWTKSKVPELIWKPLHNERKKEEAAELKKSEISRKKRSQKLSNRRMVDYVH